MTQNGLATRQSHGVGPSGTNAFQFYSHTDVPGTVDCDWIMGLFCDGGGERGGAPQSPFASQK
ncbi:hypothetical protein N7533_000420 [Penicillium manginii]|uniref:uncharacterized protein n=1 Tax=Penicillium manginii TaxID=203109 RepID=UPI002547613C|nr:uncharacterized protein N7533_000420 [Penicillium manginii]KAJ5767837.1 hypothetical protein N7533_000420 [Penicillium manginii]